MQYSFHVIADPNGGYVAFPDLPGCMTQVESPDELPGMAEGPLSARKVAFEDMPANAKEERARMSSWR